MRELNRLGVTSVIDAGGGFQNYPEDYAIVEDLHRRGEMTVRVAYNLFTQRPKGELEDFSRWVETARPGTGRPTRSPSPSSGSGSSTTSSRRARSTTSRRPSASRGTSTGK